MAATCAPVPAFGASDCDCETHLAVADARAALFGAVEDAHAAREDADSIDDGLEQARAAIDDGSAAEALDSLRAF